MGRQVSRGGRAPGGARRAARAPRAAGWGDSGPSINGQATLWPLSSLNLNAQALINGRGAVGRIARRFARADAALCGCAQRALRRFQCYLKRRSRTRAYLLL